MSGIEVAGGVGGIAVALDEMTDAASRLGLVADVLGELALDLTLARVDPSVLAASVLVPEQAALLQLRLDALAGPAGLVGESLLAMGTSRAVAGAVDLYREGELAVERSMDVVEIGVGVTIGVTAPAVAPTVAVAVALGGGDDIDRWLFDHPWAVPLVTDGLEGIVLGLGLGLPVLGVWMGGRSRAAATAYPPTTQEGALDVVIASAAGAALDESSYAVRVRGGTPQAGRAPTTVADLVANDGPTSGEGKVRVTRIVGPGGQAAWVVDIPGTSTFDPRAGSAPFDLTSAVAISARRETLTTQAVTTALADAQRRMGGPRSREEPVLFSGHSQGGMTAAALAADPRVRARFPGVTHVVTSGAPVARSGVGRDVSVLSLEHRQDPVAGLDGRDNPDRAGWVTVTRDLDPVLPEDARATEAHDARHYAETAAQVDEAVADDRSLGHWRRGADPFLSGGEATTIDYDISRVPR